MKDFRLWQIQIYQKNYGRISMYRGKLFIHDGYKYYRNARRSHKVKTSEELFFRTC